MFDPYEKIRRKARQARQGRLARIVTPGLPIDGDTAEVRRPVMCAGDEMNAILEAVTKDLYKDEYAFFDNLCEQWTTLFPDCPARPVRWVNPRLMLGVSTSTQVFALRPKLRTMTNTIKALPNAPKEIKLVVQVKTGK